MSHPEIWAVRCPTCNGKRFFGLDLCAECDGDGSILIRERVRTNRHRLLVWGACGLAMAFVILGALLWR